MTVYRGSPGSGPGSPAAEGGQDNAGFVSAYREYYPRIFAFVYSRVREVELAKDLVSEVFERAYMNWGKVRDKSAYVSWLFMIAKNTIAGHYRKRVREEVATEKTKDNLRTVADPPEPADIAMKGEAASQLLRHLHSLPKRDQDLISLKFDGELTTVEIGQVMGMHPVNVRVAVFRALRKLRDKVDAESRLERGLPLKHAPQTRQARAQGRRSYGDPVGQPAYSVARQHEQDRAVFRASASSNGATGHIDGEAYRM